MIPTGMTEPQALAEGVSVWQDLKMLTGTQAFVVKVPLGSMLVLVSAQG